MSRKIIITMMLVLIVFSGFFAFSAQAQAAGIVPCGRTDSDATADEKKPCTLCHLLVGIQRIIDYGFKIMAFVALVMLVVGGIWYIVSAGNEGMISTAKDIIKGTLFGFAIVLLAWVFVNQTLVLLAGENSDMNISQTNWNSFTCETERDSAKGSN